MRRIVILCVDCCHAHRRVFLVGAVCVCAVCDVGSVFGHTLSKHTRTCLDRPPTYVVVCCVCLPKGNVVQAGATLFPSDLERNGVNDTETIYELIYSGKNKMPGYGEGCEPRGQCTFGARLSDDEIKGVADYVLEQSTLGWK